jgi:hypothetical protein
MTPSEPACSRDQGRQFTERGYSDLLADLRGHLIQHLAQPTSDEHAELTGWQEALLPSYDGAHADLVLNRAAPADFAVRG